MSEQTPEHELREPDTRRPQQPTSEPDTYPPEPLQVTEPVYDTIEKGDKHDYETRESEMEAKDSGSDE